MIRKEIKVKQGLDMETAKKIVKKIKDSGLKVQASIMDDQVRVQAKKIDDLQAVIALCRKDDFGQPLQRDARSPELLFSQAQRYSLILLEDVSMPRFQSIDGPGDAVIWTSGKKGRTSAGPALRSGALP